MRELTCEKESERAKEKESERQRERNRERPTLARRRASENYTCMHMTLNFKRHINFLIRHIIY